MTKQDPSLEPRDSSQNSAGSAIIPEGASTPSGHSGVYRMEKQSSPWLLWCLVILIIAAGSAGAWHVWMNEISMKQELTSLEAKVSEAHSAVQVRQEAAVTGNSETEAKLADLQAAQYSLTREINRLGELFASRSTTINQLDEGLSEHSSSVQDTLAQVSDQQAKIEQLEQQQLQFINALTELKTPTGGSSDETAEAISSLESNLNELQRSMQRISSDLISIKQEQMALQSHAEAE